MTSTQEGNGQPMTAAVFFEGLPIQEDRPLGINVATAEFHRAFARYARQSDLPAICDGTSHFSKYRELVSAASADPSRCVQVNRLDGDALAKVGTAVRYDPAITEQLWLRRAQGQTRYSIVGFTHASSTAAVMDALGSYAIAPAQSWDALICASNAIKSAVQTLLDGWCDYLSALTGGSASCPMQFPVIPLGVDAERFSSAVRPEERQRQRNALGLDHDAIAVLYSGRLNHIAKANPLPLFLAAEEAAQAISVPLHVIFHGYFPDDAIEPAFKEAAAKLCKVARVSFIAHDDRNFPDGVWAAADIFCSPVDNIQESFGLTPVEAMAAGLPVIVSDWDGYRDTVRDGVDGFAVSTILPAAGTGTDIAFAYFDNPGMYGDFLSATSQSTAIDTHALAVALRRLAEHPELREKMGAAGQARVAATFDWRHVIAAYDDLWHELADRRASGTERVPMADGGDFHPLRPDPFRMFADFATASFEDGGAVELAATEWADTIKRMGLKIGTVHAGALIDLEDLPLVFAHLEASPGMTLAELCGRLDAFDGARLRRTIAWLVKLGICRYRAPNA